jgi:hypothetical protein
MMGETGIMFFPGEPFFLGGGHNLPILDQTGRTIVVKGRYAEN